MIRLELLLVVAVVVGVVTAEFQARETKKLGGQTRDVRSAEAIAQSEVLTDMATPTGAIGVHFNNRVAHNVADVATDSTTRGDSHLSEELDTLDPHYRPQPPTTDSHEGGTSSNQRFFSAERGPGRRSNR